MKSVLNAEGASALWSAYLDTVFVAVVEAFRRTGRGAKDAGSPFKPHSK
jgi:hypothetical protein